MPIENKTIKSVTCCLPKDCGACQSIGNDKLMKDVLYNSKFITSVTCIPCSLSHYLFILVSFLDNLSVPRQTTDNMEPGDYVSGNLNNLGWAIYCGIDYDTNVLKMFKGIAKTSWLPSKLDEARKYYLVQDRNTKVAKTIEASLKPIVTGVLQLFEKIIGEKDCYKANKWSIFKNDGASPAGQPPHSDYPRAHNDRIE